MLFDEDTTQRLLAEVPKMKLIRRRRSGLKINAPSRGTASSRSNGGMMPWSPTTTTQWIFTRDVAAEYTVSTKLQNRLRGAARRESPRRRGADAADGVERARRFRGPPTPSTRRGPPRHDPYHTIPYEYHSGAGLGRGFPSCGINRASGPRASSDNLETNSRARAAVASTNGSPGH